jgi:hypothetical protein
VAGRRGRHRAAGQGRAAQHRDLLAPGGDRERCGLRRRVGAELDTCGHADVDPWSRPPHGRTRGCQNRRRRRTVTAAAPRQDLITPSCSEPIMIRFRPSPSLAAATLVASAATAAPSARCVHLTARVGSSVRPVNDGVRPYHPQREKQENSRSPSSSVSPSRRSAGHVEPLGGESNWAVPADGAGSRIGGALDAVQCRGSAV